MRHLSLALVCVLTGCRSVVTDLPGSPESYSWSEWSAALLRGVAPADLPPIPVSGWRHNGVSWVRHGAEIADHNADGMVDYIRIVDPPDSFMGPILVDRDYDGYFDDYPGSNDSGLPDSRFEVPLFELTNGHMQTEAASPER
jgi:hypothetical protein